MTMASIAFGIPEGIHRIDPWPFEHMAFTRGFFWGAPRGCTASFAHGGQSPRRDRRDGYRILENEIGIRVKH